jgi:hypothetical protein
MIIRSRRRPGIVIALQRALWVSWREPFVFRRSRNLEPIDGEVHRAIEQCDGGIKPSPDHPITRSLDRAIP